MTSAGSIYSVSSLQKAQTHFMFPIQDDKSICQLNVLGWRGVKGVPPITFYNIQHTVQGASCCRVELTGIFGLASSWNRGFPSQGRGSVSAQGSGGWCKAKGHKRVDELVLLYLM